ncbi:lipocalin-like domain-containing protein [Archangium violaceum]|uniref:lipocalin-like domain-containing protein n=1 Tax=Archangium violaceum TaxID=83451 RepID=UPI0036D8FF29
MMREAMIGTWKLLSLDVIRGEQRRPLWGEAPVGQLIYAGDGRMAAEIMATDRRLWTNPDVLRASVDERAEALASYISYAGRWELEGGTVSHHIEVCVVPNWVGTRQTRRVMFSGDNLTLSTEPILIDGGVQVIEVRWRRAAAR